MTGFASQVRDMGRLTLNIELRSVNSRYLDVAFRIADDLRLAEPQLREAIGARVARGKVECRLSFSRNDSVARELALNPDLLAQLQSLQAAVARRFPDAAPLSVAELLRWPGMLADDTMTFEQLRPEIAALARSALDELVATREREGDKLATMIMERINRMRELVAQAQPKLPQIVAEYQEKIAGRLREAAATLDEERIRQEIAVFATRIDVAEELSRLTAHIDEVARVLHQGGAVGKRLDFLMQELNREANTLASKSVSTDLTGIAVELKILIEQMREQVQNLE